VSAVRSQLEDINIIWQDGLPDDDMEKTQIEATRYAAGLTSLESGVELRLDGLGGEALQSEIGADKSRANRRRRARRSSSCRIWRMKAMPGGKIRWLSDAEINRLVKFYDQAEREILVQINKTLPCGQERRTGIPEANAPKHRRNTPAAPGR